MTTISSYSTNYKDGGANKRISSRLHKERRAERLLVRLAAATLFFVLLFTGMTLVKGFADGEKPANAGVGEKVMIVSKGETLWNIAGSVREENQDIRRVIFDIKSRNNLTSSVLLEGQSLIIPTNE
ncbi:hypothetical protein Back11_12280 [Paenibacillus baekrokdamisoli]|uniref:LysM domain-containing protein n=2 Tax=Paenibacillus baekrokdamisoli TaxID=1712516 RepID=A0A3G9J536_9BACL|nr:hypothetical protein Back11_12280 [Paenibacillus baekrokdamisoli]